MMQPRFERRSGTQAWSRWWSSRASAPASTSCACGPMWARPTELAEWWEDFSLGDEAEREALVEAVREAPSARAAAKARRSRPMQARRRLGEAAREPVAGSSPRQGEADDELTRRRCQHARRRASGAAAAASRRWRARAQGGGAAGGAPAARRRRAGLRPLRLRRVAVGARWVRAYVGLGANLGDARATVQAAWHGLRGAAGHPAGGPVAAVPQCAGRSQRARTSSTPWRPWTPRSRRRTAG